MGEERGVYRVLVGKLEGKRPLGRPRHRWVDNIRMGLQEVGCGYMDWIGLTQDRDSWQTLVSAVMNLQVPWNVGNFLTSCKPVSFSRTLHHGVSKYVLLPWSGCNWILPIEPIILIFFAENIMLSFSIIMFRNHFLQFIFISGHLYLVFSKR